jgi:hypothetical protein
MKKLTMQSLATILVAVLISFSSCSKEGPAGATGATGANGATGATGPQGPAGVSNIIYSAWTDTISAWYYTSPTTTDTVWTPWEVPALTADILNKGDVRVYVNFNTAADPVIKPLPFYDGNGGYIDYLAGTGVIQLETNYPGIPGNFSFRYVLIPGGTAARKASGIDWNDYNAVKKYLNLKD